MGAHGTMIETHYWGAQFTETAVFRVYGLGSPLRTITITPISLVFPFSLLCVTLIYCWSRGTTIFLMTLVFVIHLPGLSFPDIPSFRVLG